MTRRWNCVLASACLIALAPIHASAESETPIARVYLIGNSLTWDTVPGLLDGDVQWHVDCGVSLPHIRAEPDQPCVKTSTLWPVALARKQYDAVSVQPHYGSNLEQDVETISAWMELQPHAVFVLHTGWARHAERAAEFGSLATPSQMEHSPGYIRALLGELRRLHPGRELRQTLAQNLLATVAEDIRAGDAPLPDAEALYRDAIHMTLDRGRYLMHNAMRTALKQPRSSAGFKQLDADVKKYLDGVLDWLETGPADRALLRQILVVQPRTDRSTLIGQISDPRLREHLMDLLPDLKRAAVQRPALLAIEAAVRKVGGRLVWAPAGPQWLYLATGDEGTELLDVPVAIDLDNGNNPLKGNGGRNELVTDAWLERMAACTTLRRLDLSNCAIQGDGLRHLAAMTGLRELNLTLTPVTDEALKHLGGLVELRKLGLASTQCTGAGFVHLKRLRKLESVNFHFTPLDDQGLRAISGVPIADRFWFAHTHFTDAGARHLAALAGLKRCGIGSTSEESSGQAVSALVELPLEDLALLDRQASPLGLAHAARIKSLRRLDVPYAPMVKDASMELIAKLPRLQELILGGAQVTDEGLQLLAGCKSLRKLTLGKMKQVTPAGIEQLQRSCPELVIQQR